MFIGDVKNPRASVSILDWDGISSLKDGSGMTHVERKDAADMPD